MKRNSSEISTNLRHYEINTPQYNLYKYMHVNQTHEYVISKKKQYSKF